MSASASSSPTPRILVVAFPRHVHTVGRLLEALARRGLHAHTASPGDLVPLLGAMGERADLGADRPDGVLHGWWGARGPAGTVLRAWAAGGTVVLNAVAATQLAADKFAAAETLAAAGLRQLPAAVTTDAAADAAAAARLGLPLVVKPLSGSSGRNTHLVHTPDALVAAAASIRAFDGVPLLLQPFVAEAGGRDRRLFVVDGEVVAAMERQAAPGDFRSNVAQGGWARPVQPLPEEAALAVEATGALGLDYAGVDVIPTADGPVVLEVNAEAQFEAVERVTGTDVAGRIVGALEARLGRR